MQSGRFVASVALQRAGCWLDSFGPDRRSDPALTQFAAENVAVRMDEGLEEGAVRVLLAGPDGGIEVGRDFPHGDSRDPMSAAEVRAKAGRCVAAGLPADRHARALLELGRLRESESIAEFTAAVTA
jgi:2-methylcitrate dehydratase PrpD